MSNPDHMSTTPNEREAFEAHIKTTAWFRVLSAAKDDDDNGASVFRIARMAADVAWQARAALSAAGAKPRPLAADEHEVLRGAVWDSAEIVAGAKPEVQGEHQPVAVQEAADPNLKAIIAHWNEFGAEHGFGELMDRVQDAPPYRRASTPPEKDSHGNEPRNGAGDQSPEKDASPDASRVSGALRDGANEHHEHRAGQPDPDRADDQRHCEGDGLPRESEVREAVAAPLPVAPKAEPTSVSSWVDTPQPWTLEHLKAYPKTALEIINKRLTTPQADSAQPVGADTLRAGIDALMHQWEIDWGWNDSQFAELRKVVADADRAALANRAIPAEQGEANGGAEGDWQSLYHDACAEAAKLKALIPDWRPISTAPRDGTPIRLYAQGGGFYDEDFNRSGSVEGFWCDGSWSGLFWDGQHDTWFRREGIVPTHWQPLPEPLEVLSTTQDGRVLATPLPAQVQPAAQVGELERLRAEQAAAVMPQIGPLLDAWNDMANDTKGVVCEEAPDLAKALASINHAMEHGTTLASPAPQQPVSAEAGKSLFIAACLAKGRSRDDALFDWDNWEGDFMTQDQWQRTAETFLSPQQVEQGKGE